MSKYVRKILIGIWVVALFALSVAIAWINSGCSAIARRVKTPSAISTAGQTSVTQKGDAKAPAKAETKIERRTLPLPASSELIFDETRPGIVTLRLSRDSQFVTETRTEKAEAPQSFTPPVLPTPAELAQASGVRWFYVGSLVSFALAGLLAYRAHFLAAGIAALGGVALPVIAKFFSSDAAMLISGMLLAVAAALFAAWHILRLKGQLSPAV